MKDPGIKRMRIFAGPNGSGKTTLAQNLSAQGVFNLGYFINADELEKTLEEKKIINFSDYKLQTNLTELGAFFSNSSRISQIERFTKHFGFYQNVLTVQDIPIDSYVAAVVADFLRHKLLQEETSFSFETVMSHPSKVREISEAKKLGYRTYLYFIATDSPEKNISRVQARIRKGGHSVSPDKISERYVRSLDLLLDAIKSSDRAYLFDNSGLEHILIAEVTGGRKIELKADIVPNWFVRYVEEKII